MKLSADAESMKRRFATERGETDGKAALAMFSYPVSRRCVLAGDLSDMDSIVRIAMENRKSEGKSRLCNLTFSGYREDPREVIESPEIRARCRATHTQTPYLACSLAEASVGFYLNCPVDIEIVERRPREGLCLVRLRSPEAVSRLLADVSDAALCFFKRYGLSVPQAFRLLAETNRRVHSGWAA